jgi:hypothetical protein
VVVAAVVLAIGVNGIVVATASREDELLGDLGLKRRATGTMGARRAWTVSMISALSMPCR